jgi:hypothetical protein
MEGLHFMHDTVIPEIGLVLSLFITTRMLQIVLAPDRKTTDSTVYAFATITTVAAGIGVVEMGLLVARGFVARFVS